MRFKTEGSSKGNKNQSYVQNTKFGLIKDALKVFKII